MISGVNFNCTPNSLNWMVTAVIPWLGWTMGKGNSPPARKLASLPFTAIRLGSANICNRFFCCRASITAPILTSVRVIKKLRKLLTLTVGGVAVVVVGGVPRLGVVVGVWWVTVRDRIGPESLRATLGNSPGR